MSSSTNRTNFEETHGAPLLQHAREALRSGTTLYEASTAGSIAEGELVMDDDRAARVKEWIESVGASSGNYYGVSCGNQPSTQSTHTIAKKDSSDEAAGGLLDLPASEVSADSFSEVESASGLDTNSATYIKTTHDISLTDDERVPSVLEPPAGNAIDGVKRSITPDSTANATNPAGLTEKGDTSNESVSKSAEMFLQDVKKAKRTQFRYPFESFEPLDRSTREAFITFWDR
jgi:hypothetical protein